MVVREVERAVSLREYAHAQGNTQMCELKQVNVRWEKGIDPNPRLMSRSLPATSFFLEP